MQPDVVAIDRHQAEQVFVIGSSPITASTPYKTARVRA